MVAFIPTYSGICIDDQLFAWHVSDGCCCGVHLGISLGTDDLPQASSGFKNDQSSICSLKIGEELVLVGIVIFCD